jgi:hypothetical protein
VPRQATMVQAFHRRELRKQTQGRGLKMRFRPLEPKVVNTAAELLRAVEHGETHIELRDHIDLTNVFPMNDDANPVYLVDDFPHLESMRVRPER